LIEVAERLCVLNGKLCGWLEKSGYEIEPNVVYRAEKIITAVRAKSVEEEVECIPGRKSGDGTHFCLDWNRE
jgi:hypothetical protein